MHLIEDATRLIDGRNFAFLATIMADGTPQVSPVWVDRDGDIILVNTAVDRLKQKNATRNPNVAVSLIDRKNPYERLQVRGRVISQDLADANKHIDKLAKKYLGLNDYPWHKPNERRIILRIEPSKVLYKTRPNIEP